MAMPGRGNGLEAAAYAPLADLDPQLADAMLDALRDEGVAAYVVPVPQRSLADLAIGRFERPLDRLWVDKSQVGRARALLAARLPELRAELERPAGETQSLATDEDAAWQDIVARFDAPPDDERPRWPEQENLSGSDGSDSDGADSDGADSETSAAEPARAEHAEGAEGTPRARGDVVPEDASDHYIPPPPPPLPRTDAVTKWAWVGLLGGPAYFFGTALVGWDEVSGWSAVLAIAAFMGGFVTLIARMKDRPPTDSGPDDGAVV
ncbi:MAG: hypothetical protein ACRDPK_02175 [Carbonactinosporaceae bacterium]